MHVVASVMGDTLYLSYFIECCNWLNVTRTHTLSRQDYLWQANCLECFFDFGQNAYFEMNLSLDGQFNLYEFDNYRTPSCLPPRWADGMVFMIDGNFAPNHHTYHLGIKLDNYHALSIHKINPVAILYHDGEPIFYAKSHVKPPDFHDKTYWQPWGADTFDD